MSHGNASFEQNHLVYWIKPQTVANASSASTDYFPVTNAIRIWAVIGVGATDATVDVKLEQATDASGTGLKDVTGAAITQITATGDNVFVSIDVEPAHLDIANSFDFARVTVTVGAGATGADIAAFVMLPARHMPVTQLAAYTQHVEVAG